MGCHSKLQRANLDVFMDADLAAGDLSWDAILAKLRGARTLLLVLSPKFQTSWWCASTLHKHLLASTGCFNAVSN